MTSPAIGSLPSARIKVPRDVVYRAFPAETVLLDLRTGAYHGLDAGAARMLEALERAPCICDAAAALAQHDGQPRVVLEREMCELCQMLLERGLVEIDGQPAA